MDLALNNLQGLMCHKTKQTKPNFITGAQYQLSTDKKKEIFTNKIVENIRGLTNKRMIRK